MFSASGIPGSLCPYCLLGDPDVMLFYLGGSDLEHDLKTTVINISPTCIAKGLGPWSFFHQHSSTRFCFHHLSFTVSIFLLKGVVATDSSPCLLQPRAAVSLLIPFPLSHLHHHQPNFCHPPLSQQRPQLTLGSPWRRKNAGEMSSSAVALFFPSQTID